MAEREEVLRTAQAEAIRIADLLATAKRVEIAAFHNLEVTRNAYQKCREAGRRATELRARAEDISASMVPAGDPAGSAERAATAAAELDEAKGRLAHARDAQLARDCAARYAVTDDAHLKAQQEAERLDRVVKNLTNVAPKELGARGQMIPGVAFVGAGITVDGIALESRSGAQQLELSIEIARRANRKAKFLVVDGLERIAPDQIETFVRYATRDGWQLIGTRVEAGKLVIEAIEL